MGKCEDCKYFRNKEAKGGTIMKTELRDFKFEFVGYGHYKVTYVSPITSKYWSKIVSDMQLIDATKNTDFPKRKDLNRLKQLIKQGY